MVQQAWQRRLAVALAGDLVVETQRNDQAGGRGAGGCDCIPIDV